MYVYTSALFPGIVTNNSYYRLPVRLIMGLVYLILANPCNNMTHDAPHLPFALWWPLVHCYNEAVWQRRDYQEKPKRRGKEEPLVQWVFLYLANAAGRPLACHEVCRESYCS